jgi:hypothetical protein
MSETTEGTGDFPGMEAQTGIAAPGAASGAGGAIPGDLKVNRSDDGQYLLLFAGQKLLAIYGAMGADPEVVELADGSRYAVDALLDLIAVG